MKIGMPILYEFNSIKENILLAERLKLDFIELNLNFSYCRNDLEDELVREELKKILQKNNMELTIHFFDEADFGTFDEITNGYFILLKMYIPYIKDLNIKMINFHLNPGPYVTISGIKNYIYEKEYYSFENRLFSNLNKINKICDENNLKFVIENISIPKYLERTYLLLSQKGYALNYDIGHDYTHENIIKRLITENDLRFEEMHIHDSNGNKDHLSLGEGNIDLDYFFKIAEKNQCYTLIEVKSENDLIKSIDYLNRFGFVD